MKKPDIVPVPGMIRVSYFIQLSLAEIHIIRQLATLKQLDTMRHEKSVNTISEESSNVTFTFLQCEV